MSAQIYRIKPLQWSGAQHDICSSALGVHYTVRKDADEGGWRWAYDDDCGGYDDGIKPTKEDAVQCCEGYYRGRLLEHLEEIK